MSLIPAEVWPDVSINPCLHTLYFAEIFEDPLALKCVIDYPALKVCHYKTFNIKVLNAGNVTYCVNLRSDSDEYLNYA
jgi:hypothetical protein